MPYIRIWIHAVWSTKERVPCLSVPFRYQLFGHIQENALQKGIYLDSINGYTNHVHGLISLRSDQNIAKIMQLIKGESAYWVNKNRLIKDTFQWQDEYFAISVGESTVERVRQYIHNQEQHHQKKTFTDEYQELIRKYGFERVKG